jgi:hypothetical protein
VDRAMVGSNDKGGTAQEFKALCARYGVAMYWASVLEHTMVNAMMFLDFIPRNDAKYTPEEADEFYDAKFKDTFGTIRNGLAKIANLPDELDRQLKECRIARDMLAHGFFRLYWNLDEGQTELDPEPGMKVAYEARELFQATDRALEDFLEPIYKKYGVQSPKSIP